MKGAVTTKLIGPASKYDKRTSRHFRRALESLMSRGPTQEEVQTAKSKFNLGSEDGRNFWRATRDILFDGFPNHG